ncbi:MAG: thiol methyltransferase [Ignavibacteriae bacterium]|nr:MAG: thiol methyltransferase [Ignavibacteriota bacterium]
MTEKIIDYTPEYWEKRYKEKSAQMDSDDPTPILKELLKSEYFSEPGKIAIIGCALCQDVVLFAKNNYLVTVISPSQSVINQIRKKAKKLKSVIETTYSDLFALSGKLLHKFDYLVEYSFSSEIHPDRQMEYFDNIQKLIKPGGLLIIFLQMYSNLDAGPPFPVDVIKLENHLKEKFRLIESKPRQTSIKENGYKEVLLIWKKYLV